MADKNELIEILNLKPGEVPLIGHNLPCIIGNKIFKYKYVFCGTGNLFHTLKIKPEDLVKANNVVCKFD